MSEENSVEAADWRKLQAALDEVTAAMERKELSHQTSPKIAPALFLQCTESSVHVPCFSLR
jgi:hypothetical protein